MTRLLIVGCGDVGQRVLRLLPAGLRPSVLTRRPSQAWRDWNVKPLAGDLDAPASLARLAGCFDAVMHLAPPPNAGETDSRTRNLIRALSRGTPPQRFVYISTTGVYGDHRGRLVEETSTCSPASSRARRRLDAEDSLRRWASRNAVRLSVLRAPGIYAADRSGHPRERILAGRPLLCREEDVFTNHIHADDLAQACWRALWLSAPLRVHNITDDSARLMGDHYDLAADILGLPRLPRHPLSEIEQLLSPSYVSYMRESRRISNKRMKRELKLRLTYPLPEHGWVTEHAANMPAKSQEST